MRVFRRVWAGPRIWRYTTIAAVFFALGGLGVAEASNIGLTQIGFLSSGGTNVAHVDSAGNLQVGGSVAVSNLPATQPVSGNVGVSGTVHTAATASRLASGLFSIPANGGATPLDGLDVSSVKEVTIYFRIHSGLENDTTCVIFAGTFPTVFELDTETGFADHFIKTIDPAPLTLTMHCSSDATTTNFYDFDVIGHSN